MELLQALMQNVNGFELIAFIGALIFFAARLEETSKANKELLNQELKHVISIMELNHNNLVQDINRLEKKQEESNKIKERLAKQEMLSTDIQKILQTHLIEHQHHHRGQFTNYVHHDPIVNNQSINDQLQ